MLNLDKIDCLLLSELQINARVANAELARRLNLSPPAVHARVRRLEEQELIRGYVALLDRERLGFDMLCFIQITLQLHQPDQVAHFRTTIQQIPEVLECHHVTGEYDYLLKVAVRNRQELEQVVMHKLTPIPGVARIHTSLVFSEIKASTALPLAGSV
jgi:DNA-binding Lrp family transcriptional regulator